MFLTLFQWKGIL